jgi:hypothetical protein
MSAAAMPERRPDPDPLMPDHVRATLNWLAHVIDSEISLRAVHDEEQFAQRHLGLTPAEVVSVREFPSPASFLLAGRAFAADLRSHSPVVSGCDSNEAPGWDRISHEGTEESVPGSLVAAFPAGTVSSAPLVVCFDNRFSELEIDVFAADGDIEAAEAYLQGLLARGRGELNWFRGRAVRVSGSASGITFESTAQPRSDRVDRGDLVLPQHVWHEIDVNVTALFDRRDLLRRLGLGTNRGILLSGPPGTGKTGVCRVLAAELAGRVTVMFCDARAMSGRLGELYAELVHLGPSLVILEDVDLVVGHRRTGSGGALLEFLTALDGAMTRHEDVITIATTNDAMAIDDAAKRAARFDRIIEVPLPDLAGRQVILSRYLGPLGDAVDLAAVASATHGSSGADLRELVRRAVLEHGDEVGTTGLLRLARYQVGAATEPRGPYL